jgi:hypothetical protein
METSLLILCNLPPDGVDFDKLGTYFMDFKGHGSFFGECKVLFFGNLEK